MDHKLKRGSLKRTSVETHFEAYKIICCGSTVALEDAVEEMRLKGWQLQGGVCTVTTTDRPSQYCQALVRLIDV